MSGSGLANGGDAQRCGHLGVPPDKGASRVARLLTVFPAAHLADSAAATSISVAATIASTAVAATTACTAVAATIASTAVAATITSTAVAATTASTAVALMWRVWVAVRHHLWVVKEERRLVVAVCTVLRVAKDRSADDLD